MSLLVPFQNKIGFSRGIWSPTDNWFKSPLNTDQSAIHDQATCSQDTVVVPIESQHFEFYAPGTDLGVVPLRKSPIYIEDWIGLKQLNESGRLVFIEVEGDHIEYETNW